MREVDVYLRRGSESERADVKCQHCAEVFEFGPGARYKPVAYVPSIPSWAVIKKQGAAGPSTTRTKKWWQFWK